MNKQNSKVLIIEKKVKGYALVDRVLECSSFAESQVSQAHDLQSAKKFISLNKFELAILSLPLNGEIGGDSISVFNQLKECDRSCSFIIVLEEMDRKLEKELLAAGAYDVDTSRSLSMDDLNKLIRLAIHETKLQTTINNMKSEIVTQGDNFSNLVRNSTDGIVILGKDQRIIFINPAGCMILGTKEQDAINSSFPINVDPGKSLETTLGLPGKEQRKVLLRVTDTAWAGQLSTLVIMHDITKQSKLQMQLVQSQKMEAIGRISGQVAHDFKNIIGAIEGFIDLSRNSSHADKLVRALNGIERCSKHGKALTDRMMQFSRQEEINPVVFDLKKYIEESEPILAQIAGNGVQLNFQFHSENCPINSDPNELSRIFINLVKNAKEAMNGRGKISLVLSTEKHDFRTVGFTSESGIDEVAKITVEDHGPGIEKKNIQKIFEPFFTTKPQAKGTGFGLSSVYSSMKKNGGNILVSSQVGQGCKFTLYFPLRRDLVQENSRKERDSR